jgi:hypothetical protein
MGCQIQEITAMKTTFFLLCVLCATAGFGQSSATTPFLQSTTQPTVHPMHASSEPMGQEQNLLGSGAITMAQGEMPLWEVPMPAPHIVPLGDSARMLKKEHATAKKAEKVWTN